MGWVEVGMVWVWCGYGVCVTGLCGYGVCHVGLGMVCESFLDGVLRTYQGLEEES